MLINGDEQTSSLYPITSDKENNLEILYNAKEIQEHTGMMHQDGFFSIFDDDIIVDQEASKIIVSPQSGIINGLSFTINETSILDIEAGDNEPRIDLIVLEKNQETATIVIKVKRGTPSNGPTIPTVEQTSLELYQVAIASVYIAAEQTTLNIENITDLRNPTTKEQVIANTENIAINKNDIANNFEKIENNATNIELNKNDIASNLEKIETNATNEAV